MKYRYKVFLILLVSCTLASCSTQDDAYVIDNSTVSKYTPDEPSVIPEISDIFLGEDTSSLITDHIEISSQVESEDASSTDISELEESNDETSSESFPEESSQQISDTESKDTVEIEKPHKVNGFIIYGDRGMEPFGGSAKGGGYTAEVFNRFKSAVGDDVNVYAMPIPLACTFYAPEGYKGSVSCMYDCFYGLRDALVDVEFVDLISALALHADEDIYAKTDHHWMALGAFYASEKLSEVANTEFAQLEQFKECSFDGFLGSIVSGYGVKELKNYPETFYWYEPLQEYNAHYYDQKYNYSFSGSIFSSSNSYVKFIRGDSYSVRIETGVRNGRKMLLIKDSFGNAMAPFLLAGFEEVYIIDYRDFECNILNFIKDNEITDVTLALSAFAVASSKRDNIIRLIEQ